MSSPDSNHILLVSLLEFLGSSYKSISLLSIRISTTDRETLIRKVLNPQILQALKTGILNVSNKSSFSENALPSKFGKLVHYVKNENWQTDGACRSDGFILYCLLLYLDASINGKSIDDIVVSEKPTKRESKEVEVAKDIEAKVAEAKDVQVQEPVAPLFFEEYFQDRPRGDSDLGSDTLMQSKSHEINVLYRLYAVLSEQTKIGNLTVVLDLLENAILNNAAHILQIVCENRLGSICGKDCTTIRSFLAVLIYHVLTRYFSPSNKSKVSIPFAQVSLVIC